MTSENETALFRAGTASNGSPVYERLPVKWRTHDRVMVLASPGLSLGFARDDVLKLCSDGAYEVIERSGNVCIQIFLASPTEKDLVASIIAEHARGTIDGFSDDLVVLTLPVALGFTRIEQVMDRILQHLPDADWIYGNIYKEDGETPLNWWL